METLLPGTLHLCRCCSSAGGCNCYRALELIARIVNEQKDSFHTADAISQNLTLMPATSMNNGSRGIIDPRSEREEVQSANNEHSGNKRI
jgi:hypothetical protein